MTGASRETEMIKGMVRVETRSRVDSSKTYTREGAWNGKTYNGYIYVSGERIAMSDIISSGNIETDHAVHTHRAGNGMCPICHSYCYGDCQS
jgi:hypothetical protein